MSNSTEQISIDGEMIASPQKTEAKFEKHKINLSTSSSEHLLVIFSAKYSWEEEEDNKWNDWDFFMTLTDDEGKILHSEHKHFGEDEPGFIDEDEDSHIKYLKEEAYLKYYKNDDRLKKGEGVMARSLRTPSEPGAYKYKCRIIAQFWERALGEERGLEKNKTEDIDECEVKVTVR
jgi:hypothetical protein